MSVAIHSPLHERLSYYTQTMTSSVKRVIESENLFSDSKTYSNLSVVLLSALSIHLAVCWI